MFDVVEASSDSPPISSPITVEPTSLPCSSPSTAVDQDISSTSPVPSAPLISEIPNKSPSVRAVVPKVTEEMKQIIISNDWLTDDIIDSIQQLIRLEFGTRIQATTNSATGFSPTSAQTIQIHNSLGQHWFCSSSVKACNSDNKAIEVYDSIPRTELSPEMTRQLSEKYCKFAKDGLLTIHISKVQEQSNNYDCGVFAIAFAVDLVMGISPERRVYEIANIRQHLLKILELGKIESFPSKVRNGAPKKPTIVSIDLLTSQASFARGEVLVDPAPPTKGRRKESTRQWAVVRQADKRRARSMTERKSKKPRI